MKKTGYNLFHLIFNITSIEVKFVVGKKEGINIDEEMEMHKDIVAVDVEDSYDTLALKTLAFMTLTVNKYGEQVKPTGITSN
jgi:hypothetical protein